jgi:hypothetical protein
MPGFFLSGIWRYIEGYLWRNAMRMISGLPLSLFCCHVIACVGGLSMVAGAWAQEEAQTPYPAADEPVPVEAEAALTPEPVAPTRVYRKVNPDGSVSFSDTDRGEASAETIEVRPTMTVPAHQPRVDRVPAGSTASSRKPDLYPSCEMSSPMPDETLHADVTQVTLAASLSSGLQENDLLVFYSNGQPLGSPGRETSMTLSELERGSYTVHIEVVNADGEVLCASKPVTYHVKRTSVQNKPAPRAEKKDDRGWLARLLPEKKVPPPLAQGAGSAGGVGFPQAVPAQ